MSFEILTYLCLFLGLITALLAGVFQSFSAFVMQGLLRAAPAGGIESMQQLDRTVFRSAFIAIFMALVPVSLAFAVFAWFSLDGPSSRLIIAAAIIWRVRCVGVKGGIFLDVLSEVRTLIRVAIGASRERC